MRARSNDQPAGSLHQAELQRGNDGGPRGQVMADGRQERAHHEGLLQLMANSPRLQRQCACGAPSAAGGSCAACEAKVSPGAGQKLQAKLEIGAANDPLEREADQVADQVMHMQAPKELAMGPPLMQRAQSHSVRSSAEEAPPSVELALQSPGRPLDSAIREVMEPRFGIEFGHVRVHTGPMADQSAREVGAMAYTVGSDVVFRNGHDNPSSAEGQRLLAHELAHTVQQGGGQIMQRQPDAKGSQPAAAKVVEPVNPNPAQQQLITDARRAAAIRAQTARFKAAGLEGEQAAMEARRLAHIKFDWPNPNMEQITDILAGMGARLLSVAVKVAGANDPECGMREGYVRDHKAPIILCPSFFKDPNDPRMQENRIRTMMHEMAHVMGIGRPEDELYLPFFDCETEGAFESADSWANYINCLSGQPPDRNDITVGNTPQQASPTPSPPGTSNP